MVKGSYANKSYQKCANNAATSQSAATKPSNPLMQKATKPPTQKYRSR